MTNQFNLKGKISISIVSHGHCKMLTNLLKQISELNSLITHVILTHNIPSDLTVDASSFPFQTTIIQNKLPLGFGANHNQAFKHCRTEYFCVLNPDIEFLDDPFIELIDCMQDEMVGIVAPIVTNIDGVIEDSFRNFPTPLSILNKALFGEMGLYKSSIDLPFMYPDWVAGMCMLIKSSIYQNLDGFDEKYFLYYEDTDLCLRSWRSKKSVMVSKNASIIHNAHRASHTNLKFFLFHINSMARFFLKNWLRFPR